MTISFPSTERSSTLHACGSHYANVYETSSKQNSTTYTVFGGIMRIERMQSENLVVQELPDCSRLLSDHDRETIMALNATAGAAWDACGSASTIAEVTDKMQRSLNATVSEELATLAISELEAKNLVKTSGAPLAGSRRRFIAQVGMAAVPLVIAMTESEQRAYAAQANSGKEGQGQNGQGQNGNKN
jgi:hypothetical protein